MINLKDIAHIAIAVKNIDTSLTLFRDILGMEVETRTEVPAQGVKIAMLKSNPHIELLEPTSDKSPIMSFLNKKGEGIHHIAFYVDDAAKSLEELKKMNIELIDQLPRKGANYSKIAFLNPKSTNSVLIELVERRHS